MHQLKVIQEQDYRFYEDQGYLALPNFVSKSDLTILNQALDKLVDVSRSMEASDGIYDLQAGHSQSEPKLRRIAFLDDLDPVFWDFAKDSVITDLAMDLFGSDVTFRECLINFKWKGGGQEVKWHQDIPFYPHTNLSTAQFLVFLDDVDHSQGPLQLIPGSHKGEIYEHYDENDNWLGYIPDDQLSAVPTESANVVVGDAGLVTVHHCATIHSSKPNNSHRSRPALILGYNAEDARPYTAPAYPSTHHGQVVRGTKSKYARHDPVKLRLPPDWSGGYSSIFAHQNNTDDNP